MTFILISVTLRLGLYGPVPHVLQALHCQVCSCEYPLTDNATDLLCTGRGTFLGSSSSCETDCCCALHDSSSDVPSDTAAEARDSTGTTATNEPGTTTTTARGKSRPFQAASNLEHLFHWGAKTHKGSKEKHEGESLVFAPLARHWDVTGHNDAHSCHGRGHEAAFPGGLCWIAQFWAVM